MVCSPARLALFLVLPLLAACGGCAERRERGEPAGAVQVAPPAPVADPSPTPRPVDVALACVASSDCTVSAYSRPVTTAADCYCPMCPEVLNGSAAAAHEQAWQRHCGAGFEARARCAAPMCRRPPPTVCRDGVCRPAATGETGP